MKKTIFALAAVAAATLFAADGWRELFAPDLSNADYDPAVWRKDAEGCLTAEKDVAFWTKADYGRFELECEYNLEPAANSGVLVYCSNTGNWIPNAVEIQLLDNDAPKWKGLNPRQANLSFFGHQAPTANPAKPAGQWNKLNVVADGNRIAVSLNGQLVNECDLSKWTDAKKMPDGADIPPWLSRPWSTLGHVGKIGFQGRHAGAGVRFRNVRIRPLAPAKPRDRFCLMSYNVRMGCGHDAPFQIEKGGLGYLPLCAEVVKTFAPDFLGVQEVDRNSARAGGMDQTAELARLCKMEGAWVEKITNYGISLLSREAPFCVEKTLMKGSIHTRALLVAEFPDCYVANTHFPLSEATCTAAAETVRATLAKKSDKPVFLMGDFNSVPTSPAVKSLKEDFVLLSDETKFTWNAKKPDRTIDYVFVDKRHAPLFKTIARETTARPEATDHCALVVRLEKTPPAPQYPVFRPNDERDVDFGRNRRDLWVNPDGTTWADKSLNFGVREVRDHAVARFAKFVAGLDADGVEIDWLNGGVAVDSCRSCDAGKYLGEFMSRARGIVNAAASRRGRPMKIVVRVPELSWSTRKFGYDSASWKSANYVDEVIEQTFAPAKGEPLGVPALMKTAAGADVKTVADWENVRRPELFELFCSQMYGKRPAAADKPPVLRFEQAEPDKEMMDGKAVRKRIRCVYGGKCGVTNFVFTAFIPKQAKPAPAFVLICNRDPKLNLDPERVVKSGFWPAEQLVDRGYAAIAFWNGDVTKDYSWDFENGVFGIFEKPGERTAESWGILSAWAWGASRVLDWIETEPTLDAKHVGVVGHSRGGKTALVAGVLDQRFAMTCSNCSGCGGAKLNHVDLPASEHFDQIIDAIDCWFCGNFRKYRCREREIGFDQHMWAALVAPRLLCVASASEDDWAGQEGEFATCRFASPVWELYGKQGLVADKFPGADNPKQDGFISYHMRSGEHTLTSYDWARYMDFADRHGWRK